MPFADFQPSDAGLGAVRQTFGALEGYQSLMTRAQELRVSQFDLEEKKQMLAGDLALQSTKVDQQRLLATQRLNEVRSQNLDLQVQQHRVEADMATAENSAALQKSIANTRTVNSALLLKIPDQIQDIVNTPNTPENHQIYLQKVGAFQASTAALATDPYHSNQFQSLVAPLLADSQSRGMAFQAQTRNASARLRASVTSASSMDQLGAVARDPWFTFAGRADFGGDPEFLKAYEEKQKQLSELQTKVKEAEIATGRQTRELGMSTSNNVANGQAAQTYQKVKSAYDDAVTQLNAATPNNYSDMAALTAFFKIIDPTMGFNASQEEIFKGLQPYAQRLGVNLRNVFYNGGLLSADSRAKLREALQVSFEPHQQNYAQRITDAANALRSQGIDPAGLLPDVKPVAPAATSSAATPTSLDARIAAERKRRGLGAP